MLRLLQRLGRLASGGNLDAQVWPIEAVVHHDAVFSVDCCSGESSFRHLGCKAVEIDLAYFGGGCRSAWSSIDEVKIKSFGYRVDGSNIQSEAPVRSEWTPVAKSIRREKRDRLLHDC